MEALLEQHAISEPPSWFRYGPTLLLVIALISTFALNEGLAGFFFLIPMGILFGISFHRQQQRRQREAQIRSLTMQCQLRDDPDVLRSAWRLLPQLTYTADLYARVVLLIAQSLQHVKSHEAALVAYEWVDRRVPPESEVGVFVSLQRAMLMLMTDRLSDADMMIRQLKGRIETSETTQRSAMAALLALAEMLQLLKTYNYRQLLATQANAITRLRPLGVQAGLGYGLLALAAHRLIEEASTEEQEKLKRFAKTWWQRATLLISTERLGWHVSELVELMDVDYLSEVTSLMPQQNHVSGPSYFSGGYS